MFVCEATNVPTIESRARCNLEPPEKLEVFALDNEKSQTKSNHVYMVNQSKSKRLKTIPRMMKNSR